MDLINVLVVMFLIGSVALLLFRIIDHDARTKGDIHELSGDQGDSIERQKR